MPMSRGDSNEPPLTPHGSLDIVASSEVNPTGRTDATIACRESWPRVRDSDTYNCLNLERVLIIKTLVLRALVADFRHGLIFHRGGSQGHEFNVLSPSAGLKNGDVREGRLACRLLLNGCHTSPTG
jgi:hypothetical protein